MTVKITLVLVPHEPPRVLNLLVSDILIRSDQLLV
jgi:hypothetical protein